MFPELAFVKEGSDGKRIVRSYEVSFFDQTTGCEITLQHVKSQPEDPNEFGVIKIRTFLGDVHLINVTKIPFISWRASETDIDLIPR
jgi:hypothetical protein